MRLGIQILFHKYLNPCFFQIVNFVQMNLITARTLIYYFLNDRYCHRIGRQHKSNGVYYTLQLDKMEIHQKCFDPDCRYYQSVPFLLNDFSPDFELDLDDLLLESLESFENAFTA